MSNIEVPQTYAMLHFLSPMAMDIIDYDPWQPGHPWREDLPEGHDRLLCKRRPLDKCNPEWAQHIGSEDDKRPETLYIRTQEAYTDMMTMYRLTGVDPSDGEQLQYLRTLFAAFWVFRGFVLSRRHSWDWTLLPDEIAALMPADVYGPEAA